MHSKSRVYAGEGQSFAYKGRQNQKSLRRGGGVWGACGGVCGVRVVRVGGV